MEFSLPTQTASLSVGELATFALGPRDGGDLAGGLWRAQLGSFWHREMQSRVARHDNAARFEVPVTGTLVHRGWKLQLTGRIDQIVTAAAGSTLREIKTVTLPLPTAEGDLRQAYPDYFAQLAIYRALQALTAPGGSLPPAELVFVEVGDGLAQAIPLSADDDSLVTQRLERVVEFLNLRRRAYERLRNLNYRPAFATLRPGQEPTRAALQNALNQGGPVFLEAPTGFGKTGMLLETGLDALRRGEAERVIYLTGKSTGQIQVMDTVHAMTDPGEGFGPLAAWQVRNKREHCIHHTFHCSRRVCPHLDQLEQRWRTAGLARFYLDENESRDMASLRAAGRAAGICPYEITRAALPFNDVWIGDYNYLFAPANRTVFTEQPGFNPARTLLIIDEAHNLPGRVADAHSFAFRGGDALAVAGQLGAVDAPQKLQRTWERWMRFLSSLPASDGLDLPTEDDAIDCIKNVADALVEQPLDAEALGPDIMDTLWQLPALRDTLRDAPLPWLWWSPQAGNLSLTCLDASRSIAATLRQFGGAILASATLQPFDRFAQSIGWAAAETTMPAQTVRAETPWREGAYDVAYDLRVDTSYAQRGRHLSTTAAAIAELREASAGAVAVFFPSHAYAETVARAVEAQHPVMRVALPKRGADLATQGTWVAENLALSDALFFVLGTGFTEGIDVLGGKITHAMMVGPALPEVNAVQRAKLNERRHLPRHEAFAEVYQIPGLQKVNQALGRLVRGPGQHARIVLHCKRFMEPSYARLLEPAYQFGQAIQNDEEFSTWLASPPLPST